MCYMPHSRDSSTWYSVTLLYTVDGFVTDFESKLTDVSKEREEK